MNLATQKAIYQFVVCMFAYTALFGGPTERFKPTESYSRNYNPSKYSGGLEGVNGEPGVKGPPGVGPDKKLPPE